jgi:hypothetical protein
MVTEKSDFTYGQVVCPASHRRKRGTEGLALVDPAVEVEPQQPEEDIALSKMSFVFTPCL